MLAAIISCTNTSDPRVMIGAGLLARNARRHGLSPKPWVKTSLAPGSRVVADYLAAAGLQDDLDALGFQLVGFGCTTCMGNSGPLAPGVAEEVERRRLSVAAVLSGNRNFESRIHALCRMNYLASPPLVIAYALAGTVHIDLTSQPVGHGDDGRAVFLSDLWPSDGEIEDILASQVRPSLFRERYAEALAGTEAWSRFDQNSGDIFSWDPQSTFLRPPPFFDGARAGRDIHGARVMLLLGDAVTTDHISPIGAIGARSAAGRYLEACGVPERDLGSYNVRRVNHEVMIRGTFANPRIRNRLADREGGFTWHFPNGTVLEIDEAARRYREDGTPLIVLADRDYGVGSARDWAAKGTRLLGVKAVVAESFERIHRSNLIGLGVLPLQMPPQVTVESLGIDGSELFDITGIEGHDIRGRVTMQVTRANGRTDEVVLTSRLDTELEHRSFFEGGVLQSRLNSLLRESPREIAGRSN